VVIGTRPEPWRRALEQEQFAGAGCDLGRELHRAGTGADHRDARAVDRRVVIPLRGVERDAFEGVDAGDLGEVRAVELTDRAHDRVGDERLLGAVGSAHDDGPVVVVSSHVAERTSVRNRI